MSAYPMDAFTATVTRVRRLSRDMVRLSLADEGLSGLAAPAGDGAGPVRDAYFKLLIPAPGAPSPVPVRYDESWRTRWFGATLEERGGWLRTYTLRAARLWRGPEGREGVEIDVDFFLHGLEPDAAAPAARWAAQARPGDRVTLLGPTREGALWSSWDPGRAETVIMCVDETAAPAAFSCLEDLPAGAQTRLILETGPGGRGLPEAYAAQVEAAERAGGVVHIEHLERPAGAERGEPTLRALRAALGLEAQESEALRGSLREAEPDPEELVWGVAPDPAQTYVFLAGEASVVRAARRVCVGEAGIGRESITFMGYWKAGRAES